MSFLTLCVLVYVVLARELYDKNKIDGIFSFGGLQNTTIAKNAMLDLPIGFPKMIVSTVATGQRTFDQIVDVKDITVMPAISDFSGINSVSTTILQNGVAAICGMASNGIRVIPTSRNAIIGTTVMGATNDGVANAVKLLMEKGMEVVSFHSTGAGGRAMEDLIGQNIITAVMDLTLHEVVYEYFGYGFGFGANNRLVEGVRKEIPMVVCPAGIDFMCQWKNSLFEDIDTRKYNWHNSDLAHVKLKTNEVIDISNIIIDRLNRSVKDNIVVIMPMKGFRSFTRKGEVLHDEEVDLAIIDTFRKGLKKEIPIKSINANFMDEEFSVFAANEMMRIM